MKLIFAILLTLGITFGYAQRTSGSGGYNTFNAPTKGDLEGSVYINESFSTLKVNGEIHKAKARYNAFEDKMEYSDNLFYPFQTGDELNLTDHKKKYILADYKDTKNNTLSGYLIEAQSGRKVKLYKKEKVSFVKGKLSETGYDKAVPDKYIKEKDTFFLKIGDGEINAAPDSKKNFSRLFGEKEKEIMDYLKKNNYSLSNENDLKIVFNYLNTIL